MERKTTTLTVPMSKRIVELAIRWDVSEAEAMRRLFAVGSHIVEELYKGSDLLLRNSGEEVKIIYPELVGGE